jgi:hypothetical protein
MEELTINEWIAVQENLQEFLWELRDTHKVVKETDEFVLFADYAGHELREFAQGNDVSRIGLYQAMHNAARRHHRPDGAGDPWSVADPVYVYKAD